MEWYVDKYNNTINREILTTPAKRFKESENVFKPVKIEEMKEIETIFLKKESRKVNKVNEISYDGKKIIVPPFKDFSLVNRYVEVVKKENSWLRIYYKGNLLIEYKWEEIYV